MSTRKKNTNPIEVTEPQSVDDIVNFRFKKAHAFGLLGLAAGLLLGYLIWGSNLLSVLAPRSAAEPPAQQATQPAGGDIVERRYDVPVEAHDPSFGAEDAPITIVEFSDFECPYCQRYATQTHAQLMDAYGDQIRFVYKDFPLTSIHPQAFPAALAAQCAHEQGQFWPYHDLLFSQQLPLGDEAYLAYAENLSLDLADFTACYQEQRHLAAVQADFDFANTLGVSSTPTFFVNGIAVVGAQPFSVFSQIIEFELANQGN